MANTDNLSTNPARELLEQSQGNFASLFVYPLTTAVAAVGVSSWIIYRWYRHRYDENLRANKILQRVKSSPGELPVARPIVMGEEETFRDVIRNSGLNKELKGALCRDGVYIGNPDHVVALLEKMVNDGAERFQVVTDFDATLTRYHREGKRCDTCYGLLSRIICTEFYERLCDGWLVNEKETPKPPDPFTEGVYGYGSDLSVLDANSRMPTWFREESNKLRLKYYPIELDPTLSTEEKIPHMRAWWTKAHDLMIQANFQKQWLGKMVQESSVELRERTGVLFAILDHCNIPLLIYSAGILDLIKEVLHQRCSFRNFAQHPLIVANEMRFNDAGALTGFSDELIHTFNKNEIFPHHREYFERHKRRHNVMLMGDMMGDLRMADGIQTKENVITVGFLNSKVQESFTLYRENFDIVLIDDQTMDVPIAVAESIINGNTPYL